MHISTCTTLIILQLTIETYVDSVAMLSQIIEFTENTTEEQTSEVLSTTANYFRELALFVNESNVIINSIVSVDPKIYNLVKLTVYKFSGY